jgi:hypothetical protein
MIYISTILFSAFEMYSFLGWWQPAAREMESKEGISKVLKLMVKMVNLISLVKTPLGPDIIWVSRVTKLPIAVVERVN